MRNTNAKSWYTAPLLPPFTVVALHRAGDPSEVMSDETSGLVQDFLSSGISNAAEEVGGVEAAKGGEGACPGRETKVLGRYPGMI